MYLIYGSMSTIAFLLILSVGCLIRSTDENNIKATDTGWHEVAAENFKIQLPDDLLKEDVVGFDGYAARFSNSDLTVAIESGAGTDAILDRMRESRVINFQQEAFEESGMRGTRATFEFKRDETNYQDPAKPFVRQLSIDCTWSAESVTFLVLFSDREYDETARKILDSVRVSCSK